MKKRITEETELDSQHSIALEVDAKGIPKPAVKFYFAETADWKEIANLALQACRYLLENWETKCN